MLLQELISSVFGSAAWDLLRSTWGQAETPQQVYESALSIARARFHTSYDDRYGGEHDAFFDFAAVDETLFRACLSGDAIDVERLRELAVQVNRPTPREAVQTFVDSLRAELQRTPYLSLLFQQREQNMRLPRVATNVDQIRVDVKDLKAATD